MKFEKTYYCTIFCAFCVFILSIHGKSECLVLEGEAKLKRYSSEGRGTRELSYAWSVIIDEDSSKWVMTVDYPDKGYRYKLYHDSINCYSWFYKYNGKYNDEGVDVSGVCLGEIVPGGFPYRSLPVMQVIWFGFCAENYVQANSDLLPAPWISMFSDPIGDYLRSEVVFRSHDSGSYEKVHYYVNSAQSIDPDDFRYFRRETITYGESQVADLYRRRDTPWHQVLKDGSLAGVLQRSGFVRVGEGVEVPDLVIVEAYSIFQVDFENREENLKGAPYLKIELNLKNHEIAPESFTSPKTSEL